MKRRLADFVFPPTEQKIFGIGLHKTGTRSLADALRLLGVRTLHRGDEATSALVEEAIAHGRRPLAQVGEHFEAYLDVKAIVRNFALVDRAYPESRFVLTTAPEDEWLESRLRHVRANLERACGGRDHGEILEIDVEAWRVEWREHHCRVDEYFRQRPDDLLVMDVRSGDGWEKLAPFVGACVPTRAFPWENRRGRGTYERERQVDRLRRHLHVLEGIGRRNGWWQ